MKNIFRGFVAIIIILFMIFTPRFLLPALNADVISDEMYARREKFYYGVINVWQVDCFDGGTGSRAIWLKNICSGFERQYNGVYINVESISLTMANQLISEGKKLPDIISFGSGIALSSENFEPLSLNLTQVRSEILDVCGETAVPWCMGAYFMISCDGDKNHWGNDGRVVSNKKSSKTVYSVGIAERAGYLAPLALIQYCGEENLSAFHQELSVCSGTSQEMFEAYNYSQKINHMLGTQRDLYRLNAADSREMGRSSTLSLLSGYNDLFQYIGILKTEDEKKVYTMNAFIQYLLEESQQSKLGEIGLFPVNSSATPEYNNQYMLEAWEQVKKSSFHCRSLVFEGEYAQQLNQKIFSWLKGSEGKPEEMLKNLIE